MLENAKFNSFQLGIAWNLVSAAIPTLSNILESRTLLDGSKWNRQ